MNSIRNRTFWGICIVLAAIFITVIVSPGRKGGSGKTVTPPPASRTIQASRTVLAGKKDSPGEEAIFASFLDSSLLQTHGPLFVIVSKVLDADKETVLRQLLLKRDLAIGEIRRTHMQGSAASQLRIHEIRIETSAAIEKAFGPGVAAAIRRYEETLSERQSVTQINSTLIYKQCPLSPEEIECVITVLKKYSTPFIAINASEKAMKDYIAVRRSAQHAALTEIAQEVSPVQLRDFQLQFEAELSYLKYFQMRRNQLNRPD